MVDVLNPIKSRFQTTLKRNIQFTGITLHKGVIANITIKPSEADTGITFIRIDKKKNNIIKAKYSNVSNTILCT